MKWRTSDWSRCPPDIVVDSMIVDSGTVSSAISKLFADCQIKTKAVATAVSGHSVIVKKDLAALDERPGTGRDHRERSGAAYSLRSRRRESRLPDSVGRSGQPADGCSAGGREEGQDSELHQRTLDVGAHSGYCGHRCAGFAELLRVQLPAGAGPGGGAAESGRQRDEHQHREGHDTAVSARRQRGRAPVHGLVCRRNWT